MEDLRLRAAATVEPGVLRTRVHVQKDRVEVHIVCKPGETVDLEHTRRKLTPLTRREVDVFSMSYDLYRYQEHGEPDFGFVRIDGVAHVDYFGDGSTVKCCPTCSKSKPYESFGWRVATYRGSPAKRPKVVCETCCDLP